MRVTLRGLSYEDTASLIEAMAGVRPSQRLTETIHAHTEGNPFFMREVVRLLAEQGALTAEDIGRPQRIRVPEGVREVIGQRLNRLSDECNRTLTVASVIGREFGLDLLGRVTEEASSLEVLEEAFWAHVVEEVPGELGRYQFAHALIQQTLVEELSTTGRAQLHGEIGDALEGLYADDLEAHADELAYHFAEAEPARGGLKLVRYSLTAGERALATYAWEEALAYFQGGLAAKEGQPMDAEKAALLFGLSRAQRATLGRHQRGEAVATVRPAFDYYAQSGDVERAQAVAEYPFKGPEAGQLAAEALSLVPADSRQAGRLLARYGREIHDAITVLDRALAIAQCLEDAELEQAVLTGRANAHFSHLRYRESLDDSLLSIELGRGIGELQPERDDVARYWFTVRPLIALGDIEEASRYAVTQLELARRRRDRSLLAEALHSGEACANLLGHWKVARELSDRGLAIDSRDVRLLNNRIVFEHQIGDFRQGDRYLDQLLETTSQTPNGDYLEYAVASHTIGVAASITGEARRFDVAEATAKTVLSRSPDPLIAQLARTGLALVAVQRGDAEAVKELYTALSQWPTTLTPINMVCG